MVARLGGAKGKQRIVVSREIHEWCCTYSTQDAADCEMSIAVLWRGTVRAFNCGTSVHRLTRDAMEHSC